MPTPGGAPWTSRWPLDTVMHNREGEISHGAAICDLPGGARAYVRIRDRALLEQAEREELVGRKVQIGPGPVVGEIVGID